MRGRTMTLPEIRRAGLAALLDRLGPDGTLRFLTAMHERAKTSSAPRLAEQSASPAPEQALVSTPTGS